MDSLTTMDQVEGNAGSPARPAVSTRPPARLSFVVSAEFRDSLNTLAGEMGAEPVDVLRKALGLLWIAREAKREGNGLAIVTPELEVDQEIIGF